ncbi:MAG: hypothetical protein ACYSW8_26590 [Planctomycetota bacterium]|jgi:hypothetical protein
MGKGLLVNVRLPQSLRSFAMTERASCCHLNCTHVFFSQAATFYRMDRFLSALIFLRRAKRKRVLQVELAALPAHVPVSWTNRIPAVDSKEESLGQRLKFGMLGGNL